VPSLKAPPRLLVQSLLHREDWKKYFQKKWNRSLLDGLEVHASLVLDFKLHDWKRIEKLREEKQSIGIQFPSLAFSENNPHREGWEEILNAYPWEWVYQKSSDQSNACIFSDPFFDSPKIIKQATHFRASGAHEARWVRRYGEDQIQDKLSKLVSRATSHRIRHLILGYSGRWDELEAFSSAWRNER
jgi:hypothetical protein